MKRIPVVLICCLLFLNCEDKKKEDEIIAPDIKEQSKPEPIKEEKPPKTEKDTLHQIVTLTDATLEAFLSTYGKENPERFVTMKTPQGVIELELYNNTPLHRAHFIYLIKNGYLNTTFFHRVVNDFIIQGGNSDRVESARMRRRMGDYTLPAEIIHRHNRGALAAAKEYRDNPDDRSAPFEFYIVQSRNGAHHLDANYTVFGRVVSGMSVVDAIAALDTDSDDWPLANIFIKATIKE